MIQSNNHYRAPKNEIDSTLFDVDKRLIMIAKGAFIVEAAIKCTVIGLFSLFIGNSRLFIGLKSFFTLKQDAFGQKNTV